MTPDAWLILLSTLLAVTGYLLWVGNRLPRVRVLLGALALSSFVLAVVLHDLITSRQAVSSDDRWGEQTNQPQPVDPDAPAS
jgi:hypothetical protein